MQGIRRATIIVFALSCAAPAHAVADAAQISNACVKAMEARGEPAGSSPRARQHRQRYRNRTAWCGCLGKGVQADTRLPAVTKSAIAEWYAFLATKPDTVSTEGRARLRAIMKKVGNLGLGVVVFHHERCLKEIQGKAEPN